MLTIIIPTMNRSDFVVRLLEYYALQKFPHSIFVGDSSEASHHSVIQREVGRLSPRLKATLFDCRGLNNYEVMQNLLEKVNTPYASYLADDDFLVPETLKECIAFMEKNPDYAAACGKALLFKLKQLGPHGNFEASSCYPAFSREVESNAERLKNHLSEYTSSFHAVCRTALLRRAVASAALLQKGTDRGDKTWWTATHFGELLASCSLIVQGKLKVLQTLHYVRQVHDQRHHFPQWFDLLTSPNWYSCFQIFKTHLTEDLEKQGLDSHEAGLAVQKAFQFYLETGAIVSRRNQARRENRWKEGVRSSLKKIPLAKAAWRQIRSIKEEMALENLVRPSSPHHQRFMPIYSLVTKSA